MRSFFSVAWDGALGLQRWIMFLSCAAIIVGLFAEVLGRYVFSASIFGLNEVVMIPAIWMYFMGASYAAHRGEHISANFLQVYARSDRSKAILRLVITAISLVLGVVFTYWASYYVFDSFQRNGTTSIFDIPLVIPQSAVVVSFVLMVMYTIVDLLKAISDVRGPHGVPNAVEE